jgi:hypothetical protein
MNLSVTTKWRYNDIVITKQVLPNKTIMREGRICGIKVVQSEHYKKDGYLLYYLLEPVDMIGLEHDEHFSVIESEIKGLVE